VREREREREERGRKASEKEKIRFKLCKELDSGKEHERKKGRWEQGRVIGEERETERERERERERELFFISPDILFYF
jgi:hypothetical protein